MPGRACVERKAEKKRAKRALELEARHGAGAGDSKRSKNFDDLIATAHQQLLTSQGSNQALATAHQQLLMSQGSNQAVGQVTAENQAAQDFIQQQEGRQMLTRALVEAVHEYDRNGQGAPVPALAAFHKVQAARRDPYLKNFLVGGGNYQITQILLANQDVFAVNTGIGGLPEELLLQSASTNMHTGKIIEGWTVQLVPASSSLALLMAGKFTYSPTAGWQTVVEHVEKSVLPPTIDEPADPATAMLAIRAEVMRSLHHRGGLGALNDIGQEPYVKKHKIQFWKTGSLLDVLKKFDKNFAFHDQGQGIFTVELISYDCSDSEALIQTLREQAALHASGGKKGKGKFKGKGKCKGGVDGDVQHPQLRHGNFFSFYVDDSSDHLLGGKGWDDSSDYSCGGKGLDDSSNWSCGGKGWDDSSDWWSFCGKGKGKFLGKFFDPSMMGAGAWTKGDWINAAAMCASMKGKGMDMSWFGWM